MRQQIEKRPSFSLSVGAIVAFVEIGLQVPLDSLRRGLAAVLRAERGLGPDEKLVVSPLELFAFSLAATPTMTSSWVRKMRHAVTIGDGGLPSAVIVDRRHCVELVMKNRAVTSVRPLRLRRG